MATFTFDSLSSAKSAIRKDMRARERRLLGAPKKAAAKTAGYVRNETIPEAFGELRDSVHVEQGARGDAYVVADAPHAGAVENGSRPHTPPLEPLIRWVQLRGLQGLTSHGNVKGARRRRGYAQDEEAAHSIATTLRSRLGRKGAAAWHARASLGSLAERELGVDPETVAVARAIQASIGKKGTRPHKYMMQAVPEATRWLDTFVNEALPDR